MEKREYPCPVCDASTHLGDVWVGSIHDPLGKAVKQDVRSKATGEHHAAPSKEAVLGLLVRFTKHDVAVLGKGQKD